MMKKETIFICILLVISFFMGLYLAYPIRTLASDPWDEHAIVGGMSGSDKVAIKVAADGTVQIQ